MMCKCLYKYRSEQSSIQINCYNKTLEESIYTSWISEEFVNEVVVLAGLIILLKPTLS